MEKFRSIFAIKDINIGEKIAHENIRVVRPNNELMYHNILKY